MNRWLILHSDGKVPRFHLTDVEANTIVEAIQKSTLPMERIVACALQGELGSVATLISDR